ncbi:MAG: cell wall hydrolase [Oscillospiraceae bacterium]|nr:cell wall hydrolase [Oscillospiraceae bacterium]
MRNKRAKTGREAYLGAVGLIILVVILAAIVGARAAHEAAYTAIAESYAAPAPAVEDTVTPEPLSAAIEPEELPEETPEPEPVSRYAEIEITERDEYLLDCLVFHESRGEPFEGQVAVAEVVFNRVLSPYFPDTVEEVIFQKYGNVWQFSPAPYLYTATPNEENCNAVWVAYRALDPVTTLETVYFSTEPYNDHILKVIGGHYFCELGLPSEDKK